VNACRATAPRSSFASSKRSTGWRNTSIFISSSTIYKTHKTKEVQAWLAKHPRFKLHFTPTSSSWINLVEHFFAEITGKRILAKHNANPKPFKWTATASSILEKNARARAALEKVKAGTK
jgi:transposase